MIYEINYIQIRGKMDLMVILFHIYIYIFFVNPDNCRGFSCEHNMSKRIEYILINPLPLGPHPSYKKCSVSLKIKQLAFAASLTRIGSKSPNSKQIKTKGQYVIFGKTSGPIDSTAPKNYIQIRQLSNENGYTKLT